MAKAPETFNINPPMPPKENLPSLYNLPNESVINKNSLDEQLESVENLPTMYDLPSEYIGDEGVPDEFHVFQGQLLRETFQPPKYFPDKYFVGVDINFYYDKTHILWYKRPDWFAALEVPRLYNNKELRYSYVLWQEKVSPFIVIEFLSESTENQDLGKTFRESGEPPTKWQVYEEILKIPFYITFDRVTDELIAFRLKDLKYEPFTAIDNRFYLEELDLTLGLWQGKYEEIDRLWLRWYDKAGNLIPNNVERIELERSKKDFEKEEKEKALARAALLAQKLKDLGIDPNSI